MGEGKGSGTRRKPLPTSGCRLLTSYEKGKVRIVCRVHPHFQTPWLPRVEAALQASNHMQASEPKG